MSGPSQNRLLYGSPEPLPERIALNAGPLSLFFENGDLRTIRFADREVLRRIYVAVRDANWGTIPARLSGLNIHSDAGSFRVTFKAEHRERDIDFAWDGEIEGGPDGTIGYRMKGEARTTFLRTRIGICVLHPVEECRGVSCVVEKVDGSTERGSFPRYISPHQPFKNIRSIEHQIVPGLSVRVEFSGDVFEMEDQRNWTDASFKTYSTPLELPFPVEIGRGTRVTQTVRVRLRKAAAAAACEPARQIFRVQNSAGAAIPRIGLGMASHGEALSERETTRLGILQLNHLRADLHMSKPDWECSLAQASSLSGRLGLALEIAVFLSDAAEAELRQLEGRLWSLQSEIDSCLIFHAVRRPIPATWIGLAREALKSIAPGAHIGSRTDAYFVEWNRKRPPFESLDLTCYSVNPQVHAFDNATMVENLRGLNFTVESAIRSSRGLPLAISPVTLRPRFQASATRAASGPEPGKLPFQVDARQASLFGAGWTACSLKYLADPHVRSITYYETTGWRGVMETESGSPLPALFPSLPGAVFPLYHVLADFGEHHGGLVLKTCSSDPLRFDGVALKSRGQISVLLCSWLPEQQTVHVTGIAGDVRVRRLNAETAIASMADPEHYRSGLGQEMPVSSDGLEIQLLPFELVWLEMKCEE